LSKTAFSVAQPDLEDNFDDEPEDSDWIAATLAAGDGEFHAASVTINNFSTGQTDEVQVEDPDDSGHWNSERAMEFALSLAVSNSTHTYSTITAEELVDTAKVIEKYLDGR
jgi:hypothetical protein